MSACRGTLLLKYADKREEGGQKSENFAEILCEYSQTMISNSGMNALQYSDFRSFVLAVSSLVCTITLVYFTN